MLGQVDGAGSFIVPRRDARRRGRIALAAATMVSASAIMGFVGLHWTLVVFWLLGAVALTLAVRKRPNRFYIDVNGTHITLDGCPPIPLRSVASVSRLEMWIGVQAVGIELEDPRSLELGLHGLARLGIWLQRRIWGVDLGVVLPFGRPRVDRIVIEILRRVRVAKGSADAVEE